MGGYMSSGFPGARKAKSESKQVSFRPPERKCQHSSMHMDKKPPKRMTKGAGNDRGFKDSSGNLNCLSRLAYHLIRVPRTLHQSHGDRPSWNLH